MKKIFYILLLLLPFEFSNAQKIQISHYSLTGISTEIKISQLPPKAEMLVLKIKSGNFEQQMVLQTKGQSVDTSFVFQSSGTYSVNIRGQKATAKIRVLPGWLSIVPPLVAILLALIIREVLVSLLTGIFIGALFIFNFNPFTAFLRMTDTILLNSLVDRDHLTIIVFTLLFGAVIGVIAKNGGTAGISKLVIKLAKTPRSGLIATWLMGLAIFFDDYANSLIIGNMMRPITDKLRISREKLAYIVDSTAAPVASLVIISSWIGFEVGLIQTGLNSIGSTRSAYGVFIDTIPFRFYPIAALFFVFITSYMNRDFGPMYKAERRAREEGILHEELEITQDDEFEEKISTEDAKWENGVIPILILILGTIAGLIFTGIDSLKSQGIHAYSLRQIISNSDSFSSLLWASFSASIVAVIMTVWQRRMKLTEAVQAWNKGIQSMLFAVVILVFAWSLSLVTVELKTADYLISILQGAISPHFLPVIVFIICAFISFATGTSWGTMAIVIPIVIPLAYKLSLQSGLDPETSNLILVGVVSSVLAGSVFGDHCSPIADTTILSSIASHCNHLAHVNTQLPYAIVVALVCMLLGDIPTAFGLSPYISIILIFAVLTLLLRIFGKKLAAVNN